MFDINFYVGIALSAIALFFLIRWLNRRFRKTGRHQKMKFMPHSENTLRKAVPVLPYNINEQSSFGATVRILSSEETDALGLSGKRGKVFGETKPSSSGVEGIIGGVKEDFALNIYFKDLDEQYWFAPHLLEYIE